MHGSKEPALGLRMGDICYYCLKYWLASPRIILFSLWYKCAHILCCKCDTYLWVRARADQFHLLHLILELLLQEEMASTDFVALLLKVYIMCQLWHNRESYPVYKQQHCSIKKTQKLLCYFAWAIWVFTFIKMRPQRCERHWGSALCPQSNELSFTFCSQKLIEFGFHFCFSCLHNNIPKKPTSTYLYCAWSYTFYNWVDRDIRWWSYSRHCSVVHTFTLELTAHKSGDCLPNWKKAFFSYPVLLSPFSQIQKCRYNKRVESSLMVGENQVAFHQFYVGQPQILGRCSLERSHHIITNPTVPTAGMRNL